MKDGLNLTWNKGNTPKDRPILGYYVGPYGPEGSYAVVQWDPYDNQWEEGVADPVNEPHYWAELPAQPMINKTHPSRLINTKKRIG